MTKAYYIKYRGAEHRFKVERGRVYKVDGTPSLISRRGLDRFISLAAMLGFKTGEEVYAKE